MKRSGKTAFFIVALLILAFAYLSFFGIGNYYGDFKQAFIKGAGDIRWGIDIQGGVEAIFTPDVSDEEFAAITPEEMEAAETIINTRLVNKNITDSEVYTDNEAKQIIVRFPWQSDEEDYDPKAAVAELGETAQVIFSKGTETPTSDTIILQGAADVESAEAVYSEKEGYAVRLTLTEQGKSKFAVATAEMLQKQISIWMDSTMLSAPTVQTTITDGVASITGMESAESAQDLADKINAGSLPFALSANDSISTIAPTLGEQSLDVMLYAGIVATCIIFILMLIIYRLPGFVACISLLGQIAGMLACTSGFFPGIPSFTLTIPGIAGIILSIGMGVDANVITSERIKEGIRAGKTVDGAVAAGSSESFSAIFDGNVTVIIVSIMLMGVFGPYNGIWSKVLYPFMWLYNHTVGLIPSLHIANTITGSIYSFGFTLLIGVIFNFVMGVTASKIMLKGLSKFKGLRNPRLYGGVKNA